MEIEIEEQRSGSIWYMLLGVVAGVAIGWLGATSYSLNDSDSQPAEEQLAESSENAVPKVVVNEGEKAKVRRVIVDAEKNVVVKGETYSADIIVADVDTTLQYTSLLGGKEVENNKIQFICCAVGEYTYKGIVRIPEADGSVSDYPFSKEYKVIEPKACLASPYLLKGKENPVMLSAFGIPYSDISISVTNAQSKKTSTGYLLKPDPGAKTCVVIISANLSGRKAVIAKQTFQVVE